MTTTRTPTIGQSRAASLIEAVINVATGFVVSIALTAFVLPKFGCMTTIAQDIKITTIFTVASIARSYAVRRWFNARIHRAAQRIAKETA